MALVEREGARVALERAVAGTEWGVGGRPDLVAGEAGAGRTALPRAFLDGLPPGMGCVLGACDRLPTARAAVPG